MVSGEHHNTVAVASLYREDKISFCLPERGGDADVFDFRAIDPACRLHYRPFDLH